MSPKPPNLTPYQQAFQKLREEYQDHLPLVQRLQESLRNDADQLKSQEGWDLALSRGVDAWVEDTTTIFRFLKRREFDEAKTYQSLLDALQNRATHNLHLPIPSIPPYSTSSLFHVLPLPHHTDICGRPIVVITCRDIRRNEAGELEDLVEWVWRACEMLRRTLADYWGAVRWGDRKGYGGEGCVVIVDAGGAGYRNLEIELLPTLANVGTKNFPGMIQSMFVVNAGWTQRSLWGMIKAVLPRATLARIRFIDKPSQLAECFDLDKVPIPYGGRSEYSFAAGNPILEYYQSHSIGHLEAFEDNNKPPLNRNISFASTAEVFYTADNTPNMSRVNSATDFHYEGRVPHHLQFTALPPFASHPSNLNISTIVHTASRSHPSPCPDTPHPHPLDGHQVSSGSDIPLSRTSSHTSHSDIRTHASSEDALAPYHHIKSLIDFKLYLSPSRLAQVELLNNPDSSPPRELSTMTLQRRRTLRPAILECGNTKLGETIASRRSRPPLLLLGAPHLAKYDSKRSYSDLLLQHHAVELEKLDQEDSQVLLREREKSPTIRKENASSAHQEEAEVEEALSSTAPTVESTYPSTQISRQTAQDISAYSRSSNPYYGYPVMRISDPDDPSRTHIEPKYARRRKRDLIKTLLFLFLLRLQSFRDQVERALGLNRLLPWTGGSSKFVKAKDPVEGLKRTAFPKEGKIVKRTWESDWVWMIVGFMLMRGTWSRLVVWPLEMLGMEGVRELLGLT